jgi:hypothetical protein
MIREMGRATGEMIREHVQQKLAPVLEELGAVKAELSALQDVVRSEKSLKYRGVHEMGAAYDTGDTVTQGGSLWHCNVLTKERPGEGSKDWTLAVKRGRDGKDLTR